MDESHAQTPLHLPPTYLVPSESISVETEVKKSRFIAYAFPVESRQAALEKVQQLKIQYPDARHHCWAYLIGPPKQPITQAFDDDGEPAGTAGKPILNVLNHKEFGDILIVVVRYFGGIKLGAGGLTRAYGQAAQAVMAQLQGKEKVPQVQLQLQCDFAQEQKLRHLLKPFEGEVQQLDYQQQVNLTVQLPAKHVLELKNTLAGLGILAKNLGN